VGEEVQAEGELFEAGQIGERLELAVGVEAAAGARVPHRRGQVELAEGSQGAEALELSGLDQRADKIDPLNAEISGGKVFQCSDWAEAAFRDNAAALPNNPFSHLALRRPGCLQKCCTCHHKHRDHPESGHLPYDKIRSKILLDEAPANC